MLEAPSHYGGDRPLNKQSRTGGIAVYLFLYIPVVWAALLIAQSLGGGLPDIIANLTAAMEHPFRIHWTEHSLVTILLCTGAYIMGICLYADQQGRTRDGEKHGSAAWASPRQVNAMFAQKQNKLLTKNVRLGLDTHKHRRSLNVLGIGGSGAAKTRSYVKPNILEANTNYVITDPKSEVLLATGGYLKSQGYDIRVLNLVNLEQSDGYNPFRYIRDEKDALRLVNNLIQAIMLTIRPLKPDGRWGPKCRKVYDLDSQGNRIPDGKGGWKNHREDTTDWNNRENAEKWRAAWAAYANRALEVAGRLERIDHRSYERQGIEKIPTIHMGVAASQMERRGIRTEKGDLNRQITADNKLLKELKARITRIYNWSKEQAAVEPPQDGGSLVARLYEAQAQINQDKARSRNGKIKALQENAKLLAFLQGNGINSMHELYDKVAAMNKYYYDLRGKIVKAERRLAVLDERLEMWEQYKQYKPTRQKLDKVKPCKREKYQQEHRSELAAFDAAADFLKRLKESGEKITPKAWRAEAAKLIAQKDFDYQKMRDMRDEIKAVENLRKAADRLAREGQHQRKEQER